MWVARVKLLHFRKSIKITQLDAHLHQTIAHIRYTFHRSLLIPKTHFINISQNIA